MKAINLHEIQKDSTDALRHIRSHKSGYWSPRQALEATVEALEKALETQGFPINAGHEPFELMEGELREVFHTGTSIPEVIRESGHIEGRASFLKLVLGGIPNRVAQALCRSIEDRVVDILNPLLDDKDYPVFSAYKELDSRLPVIELDLHWETPRHNFANDEQREIMTIWIDLLRYIASELKLLEYIEVDPFVPPFSEDPDSPRTYIVGFDMLLNPHKARVLGASVQPGFLALVLERINGEYPSERYIPTGWFQE